jgi:hypothetical protein
MSNCDKLFKDFNENLKITTKKKASLKTSKDALRKRIVDYFAKHHPKYKPMFYIQGSYKMKTTIRTKDDTCDLDDGVYFKSNPDNVTATTLQKWVKDAVDGVTEATPSHRSKCITVDYKAGYNIDLPVFVFDEETEEHPQLAIKNAGFRLDDPKEFIEAFEDALDSNKQLLRIVRYLKAWCDHKREKMPSGLVMTVLAMDHFLSNDRDDVALKFVLIEIEKALKKSFTCKMPTTPKDDLLDDYDENRKSNFMSNLEAFIIDAKKAVDEKNNKAASKLWQKHLGSTYFPDGVDEDETPVDSTKLSSTIGLTKPYYNG